MANRTGCVLSKAGAGSLAPGWRRQALLRGCQHIACAGADVPKAAVKKRRGQGLYRGRRGSALAEAKTGLGELDPLAFHLAGQLVHKLLGARPVGVDLEQLLKGLQGSFFLADLA